MSVISPLLGRAGNPWDVVYQTLHERMERVPVPGGWIYRNWAQLGTDSLVAQVSMTFVPAGEPIAPINIDAPYIEGVNKLGETLTCTTGNWVGTGITYGYQWKSDTDDVGTDSSSYVVADTDLGKSVTCIVTATNDGGSTASPPSNAIQVG